MTRRAVVSGVGHYLPKRVVENAHFESFLDTTDDWLTVEHRTGADGVEATYRDLLEGRADPAIGYVCAMDAAALAE